MNEQQTKDAAAIMLAARWVDGRCVNVETRGIDGGDWWANPNPDWAFGECEYRIATPDEVWYHVMDHYGTRGRFDDPQTAREYAREIPKTDGAGSVLKVTTKPDGTKTAEFIEVGQ